MGYMGNYYNVLKAIFYLLRGDCRFSSAQSIAPRTHSLIGGIVLKMEPPEPLTMHDLVFPALVIAIVSTHWQIVGEHTVKGLKAACSSLHTPQEDQESL